MANLDFSQLKGVAIPDGNVVKIEINGTLVWKAGPTNQVPLSINPDGSIYNGKGYKDGYRIRSGGVEAEAVNTSCTGFIEVAPGDVVRFSGMPWFDGASSGNALNAADANFANLGQFTIGQNSQYGIFLETAWKTYAASSIVEEKTGVWKWIVPPAESGVAYIRITAYDKTGATKGANMIVTINEEIN